MPLLSEMISFVASPAPDSDLEGEPEPNADSDSVFDHRRVIRESVSDANQI